MRSMYGYRADFIYDEKMKMLLSREPAVHSDELDRYQVKMLRYNEVPYLLPVEIREVDFEVDFLYDISGKKMLEQVLRSVRMSAMQYFEWMYQLVKLLEQCRAYMLHPNQMMLHEQFIFVAGDFWHGNLCAAYVPVVKPLHPQAGMEGLKRIGILLSSYVMHWTGEGFQRLVQLLAREGTSLVEIRNLLQSLLFEGSGAADGNPMSHTHQFGQAQLTPPSTDISSTNDDEEMRLGTTTNRAAQQQEASCEEAWSDWSSPKTVACDEETPYDWGSVLSISSRRVEQVADSQVTRKKHTAMITGAVVTATAFGWKLGYLSKPTIAWFIGSLAWSIFSVVLGALCLTRFLDIWLNKRSSHEGSQFTEHHEPKSEQCPSEAIRREQQPFMRQLRTTGYSSMDDYYTQLKNDTTILDISESDATVMLGEAGYHGEDMQCSPYLQQLDETGLTVIETLPLEMFPFIIGRAEQGVNFRDESIGVSKHHCEFVRSDSRTCEVRDLGSKNGTELQGEMLIPYKLYPLKDGDKLLLARSQYLYRAGRME